MLKDDLDGKARRYLKELRAKDVEDILFRIAKHEKRFKERIKAVLRENPDATLWEVREKLLKQEWEQGQKEREQEQKWRQLQREILFKELARPGPKLGGLERKDTKTPKKVDTTLYLGINKRRFIFKGKKSRPIPAGYSVTIAQWLLEAWGNGKPLTQKEILERAGRWKKGQVVPLRKDRQWVYDRITPIRKALLSVGVNMPQATQGGYAPPQGPSSFAII